MDNIQNNDSVQQNQFNQSNQGVQPTPQTQQPFQNVVQTPTKEKKPLGKIIAVVAVVLTLIGGGYFAYKAFYPAMVVRGFFKTHIGYLRDKQYSTAYNQMSQIAKNYTTLEEYQNYADVMGLSSRDIPFKVTNVKVYRAQDLTDQADISFNLVGKTGVKQPMKMHLIKELGDYTVRFVEVTDSASESSWIGFKPEAETKKDITVTSTAPSSYQETPPSPYGAVDTTEVATIDTSDWTTVTDSSIRLTAQVVAEQHLGFLRFPDEESIQKAVAQLHPQFMKIETPASYIQFLERVGIINVNDFSVTTGDIIVKRDATQHVAKVQFIMRDFSTSTGEIPEGKNVYVGIITSGDPKNRDSWKVISLFTEEYIKLNPSFFPF